MVAELCEKLIIGQFESFKGTEKVVRLDYAFTAFSAWTIRSSLQGGLNFITMLSYRCLCSWVYLG